MRATGARPQRQQRSAPAGAIHLAEVRQRLQPLLVVDLHGLAVARARPLGERQVDPEEGLKALTHFREMDRAGRRAALLALWPRTGRTHQLRVHCAEMGCPILGDRKYGGEEASLANLALSSLADSRKLHLHARRIALPHPSGKGELVVEAELPPHFRRTVEAFGFSTQIPGD